MTSTGLADWLSARPSARPPVRSVRFALPPCRGSNFIRVETEETSELSNPLMTDRVYPGLASPRLASPLPFAPNDIPPISASPCR